MTNTEILKSWSYFEKDGWICSPHLNGEAIFQVGEVDSKDMSYLIHCISSTAFNAGSRFTRESAKEQVVNELEKLIKKVKKS